ncbi:CDP-alcohol phosphatidyltransferase family protein [Anaerotignum sp.]|uniref:CDP-alcohol phosphatidyltransferase family protein n=1 Tax=Anaerotignum sp. TaxID=2039241 RepID=UPI0027147931|nr:CDP-alcohol phosphatidyltransferase family protein [Anaerotignum sp.]
MGFIPNVITIARIIGSVFLLSVVPFSGSFFALYFFCGISDMLDGYVARRYEMSSPFGATLDSIADCVFVFVMLYVILPVVSFPKWALYWMGGIFLIKACTFTIGIFRYQTLAFLHTYLNKAAGALLFAFPMLYYFWGIGTTAVFLCTIATVAAIEELGINILQKELQRDRKSLFLK